VDQAGHASSAEPGQAPISLACHEAVHSLVANIAGGRSQALMNRSFIPEVPVIVVGQVIVADRRRPNCGSESLDNQAVSGTYGIPRFAEKLPEESMVTEKCGRAS
jgi:hypothetical protein